MQRTQLLALSTAQIQGEAAGNPVANKREVLCLFLQTSFENPQDILTLLAT